MEEIEQVPNTYYYDKLYDDKHLGLFTEITAVAYQLGWQDNTAPHRHPSSTHSSSDSCLSSSRCSDNLRYPFHGTLRKINGLYLRRSSKAFRECRSNNNSRRFL